MLILVLILAGVAFGSWSYIEYDRKRNWQVAAPAGVLGAGAVIAAFVLLLW